jgi:hypothetical protein
MDAFVSSAITAALEIRSQCDAWGLVKASTTRSGAAPVHRCGPAPPAELVCVHRPPSSGGTRPERPGSDRVLEAFYPVIDQRIPVLFKSEKMLDAHRILNLKSDLGFSLIMADVKEGWPVSNKIKASSTKVFLSLDFLFLICPKFC